MYTYCTYTYDYHIHLYTVYAMIDADLSKWLCEGAVPWHPWHPWGGKNRRSPPGWKLTKDWGKLTARSLRDLCGAVTGFALLRKNISWEYLLRRSTGRALVDLFARAWDPLKINATATKSESWVALGLPVYQSTKCSPSLQIKHQRLPQSLKRNKNKKQCILLRETSRALSLPRQMDLR